MHDFLRRKLNNARRKGRKLRAKVIVFRGKLPLLLGRRPHPSAVASAYSLWLFPNEKDATYQFYVQGTYGYVLSNILQEQKDAFLFMDIGANQGLYSMIAAKNPCCTHTYAFEPVPTTLALMQQNLALNEIENVTLIDKAISDQSGTAAIQVSETHSGVATLRDERIAGAQDVTIETVDAAALNALIPEANTRMIVKIDVEGHELTVIEQLLKSHFAARIEMIYYECDEDWFYPAIAEQMLREVGFTSFKRNGSGRHYDTWAAR